MKAQIMRVIFHASKLTELHRGQAIFMLIKFEKALYSKEVLLKTALVFIDKAYIHISQNEKEWIISWKNKADSTISSDEFENELISQQLRSMLIHQNADIRKLVLARAFATTIIEEAPNQIEGNNFTNEQTADSNILQGWFDQHSSV